MTPRNRYPRDTAALYPEYVRTGVRYRKVAEALVSAAGSLEGMSVVDIGCGTGLLTGMLSEQVGASGTVFGIDASLDMLSVARLTTKATNVHFIHSGAEHIDKIVHEPLDAAFSSAAFWQFDKEMTLTALASVMRQGGTLCFNLSAGFFDFKASGFDWPGDQNYFKQSEVIAEWARTARKRFPGRAFPPKVANSEKRSKQNLDDVARELESHSFKLKSVVPLAFEIPRDDEYRWLRIPQWTDRQLGSLSGAERTKLLDEVFMGIPDKAVFLGRWVTIVAVKG